MEYEAIQTRTEGSARIIRLHRPEKRNALSRQLGIELLEAVQACDGEPSIRGIIITGSDAYFSSGVDLNEALTVTEPHAYSQYQGIWRQVGAAIERSTKPVIAAVSGYAITGGMEIAMCCDIRLASRNAVFAITSTKIGSVSGFGGTQRLPRLVGMDTAMDMLFTARKVGAEEAHRIGLVTRVVPDGTVVDEAKAMVEALAANGPLAITWCKQALRAGMNVDLESALDLEASFSAQAFASADKAEGMRAFLEKRTAVFAGK